MRNTRFVMLRRIALLGLLLVLAACSQAVAVTPDVPTPCPDENGGTSPVLTWERVGGIAGFCDGLSIYADGRVVVTTCEGEPVAEGALSPERKVQLDAWLTRFAGFESEETDPATADAMTVRVAFAGGGSEAVSDADRQMLVDFAAAVFAGFAMDGGAVAPTPTPLTGVMPVPDAGRAYDAARDALIDRLGIELSAMEQVAITEEVWRDSCLGLPEPGEMCAMALTPGFRVVIDVNGTQYVIRTNRDSSMVRVEGETEGEVGADQCLTDFEAHPLAGSDDPDRMTLAPYELDWILRAMQVTSICVPAEWGAPYLNVDWNAAETPGATGRMVSLGFENLYSGEGWSDIYLLYSTYDFAAGTEYDRFATREDWEAVHQGTMQDMIEAGGMPAFVRFHRGLCYGQCPVFRTIVVPFESDYVAVVQRLGEVEGDADWEALVEELRMGEYPEGWQMPTPAMALFVSSLRFSSQENRVSWEDAVALILEGRVEQVFQTHALEVTLTLKDGSVLRTIEPSIDEVFAVVQRCGDVCKDIVLATE